MCSTGRNGEGNLAQNTKLGKYTAGGYKLSLKIISKQAILYGPYFIGYRL